MRLFLRVVASEREKVRPNSTNSHRACHKPRASSALSPHELHFVGVCRSLGQGGPNVWMPSILKRGEMAEWSMAVVLKTTEPETVPGVRIPLSPPTFARVLATGS